MKSIVLLILFLLTINSFAQNKDTSLDLNQDSIYEFYQCDEKAFFPGGDAEMMKFIAEHFKCPKISQEQGIEGTIYLRFVIKKSGKIGEIKVLRSGDPLMVDESIRLLKSIPKWIPAKIANKPVNSWFIIPFRIHFQ